MAFLIIFQLRSAITPHFSRFFTIDADHCQSREVTPIAAFEELFMIGIDYHQLDGFLSLEITTYLFLDYWTLIDIYFHSFRTFLFRDREMSRLFSFPSSDSFPSCLDESEYEMRENRHTGIAGFSPSSCPAWREGKGREWGGWGRGERIREEKERRGDERQEGGVLLSLGRQAGGEGGQDDDGSCLFPHCLLDGDVSPDPAFPLFLPSFLPTPLSLRVIVQFSFLQVAP